MKFSRSYGRATALIAASLFVLAGCSTVSKVLPRRTAKGPSVDAQLKATEGQRIPLLALDQQLNVSDALKGQSFYIPPAQPLADCPLPGCTPEQSVENVAAASRFQVAWRRDIGKGSNRTEQITAPPILA